MGTQNTIMIMAYASSGKTTTLVQMFSGHPIIKFLLVIFTKKVFPPNALVKTTNALKYKLIPETAGYDSFQHNGLKYTTLTTSLIWGKLVPQGCRGHGDLHYVLQQGGEGGGDGVNHWQEE